MGRVCCFTLCFIEFTALSGEGQRMQASARRRIQKPALAAAGEWRPRRGAATRYRSSIHLSSPLPSPSKPTTQHTMSSARPLDNSNPTIVVPTATTGPSPQFSKASQKTKLERLWRDEAEDEDEAFDSPGDSEEREEIDEQEVFGAASLPLCFPPAVLTLNLLIDLLRSITDPEHPLTLEQLAVVSASQIKASNKPGHERVLIEFTPTIPHCSMATLIGESVGRGDDVWTVVLMMMR